MALASKTLALISATTILTACPPLAFARNQETRAACSAAAAAYEAYFSDGPRPAQITDVPPTPFLIGLKLGNPLGGWLGDPPPLGLLSRLAESNRYSAVKCPEVRRVVGRRQDRIVTSAEAEAAKKLPSPAGTPYLYSVGAPVLSGDKRAAVVLIESTSGGLAGSQKLIYLKLTASGWAMRGLKVLAIS